MTAVPIWAAVCACHASPKRHAAKACVSGQSFANEDCYGDAVTDYKFSEGRILYGKIIGLFERL